MTLPPIVPMPPEHDAWAQAGPRLEPPPYVDWPTFKVWSDGFYVAIRQLELRANAMDGRINGLDERVRALENPR